MRLALFLVAILAIAPLTGCLDSLSDANKAIDSGADLRSGHRYLGHRKSSDGIIATIQSKSGKIELETKMLIGSDGPASRVARDAGLSSKREVLAAFGAE